MLTIQRETRMFTDIYAVTHFSLLSLINLHPNQLHLFNQVSRFTRNIFNSMANMGLSFRCRRLGFSPFFICVCYRDNFLNSLCLGFLDGANGKEPTCQCRRHKRPGSGRSLGEENGNSLQYSCLENPMDRGIWQAIVHRVTKSQTGLRRLSMNALVSSPIKSKQ